MAQPIGLAPIGHAFWYSVIGRRLIMALLTTLFRFAVGCYFVKAGSDKMGRPSAFWNAIMSYKLVDARTSRYMASLIPPLEFFAGLMLASNVLPFLFASIILVLLLVFSIAIVWALSRGTSADCGCGGAGGTLSPRLVARNAVLGLMLVPVLVGGMGSPRSQDLVVAVVSLAAVLVIAVLRNRAMVA